MHTPRETIAACILILAASSCLSGTRQVEDTPRRHPKEPPGALEATSEEATSSVERPRLQRGAALLGAPVEDSGGVRVGAVEDVLIEPATGEVVAVLAALRLADGRREATVLEYAAVDWPASESEGARVVLDCALDELSRDLGYAGLFDGQEVSDVKGEVTEVVDRPASARSALILKVHDQDNLLHRVLVEPARLVRRRSSLVEPGSAMTAEGVLTRDDSGKLLVASAIGRDGERLELRDSSGAILWGALTQGFLSARSLPEQPLVAADGSPAPITGWLLDRTRGVAEYACVEVDGVERALPWAELERDVGSRAWAVARDRAALTALPVLSPDDPVPSDL